MSIDFKLSVIIPCYNEEDIIEKTYDRVLNVMINNAYENYELLFIDDGSKDKTLALISGFAEKNKKVKVLSFSRNFGHQAAVTAGIFECTGDAAIIIDADLQDPPELFPEIIKKWKDSGANVVYCVRKNREGVGFFKNIAYKAFYRIVNSLSDVDLPLDSGDFRLIDRYVMDGFKSFKEKNKYVRGIISWMGYNQVPFEYDRPGRQGGETKYSIKKLLNLASVGMFYFSKKPLKVALSLGFLSLLVGLGLMIMVFIQKYQGILETVPGWASLIITIIFFGGVQLITIGVMGEYVGNIFDEVKERPEYLFKKKIN